jgi:hypothetical protein
MVEDIYQRLKEGVANTSGLVFTVLTTGFSIGGGNPNSKTLTVVGDATVSGVSSGTNTGDQTITLTGDVTGTGTGSFVTTIATGVIVDADVNGSAAIGWGKISKTGSSLADLTTRSATDLTSGTLPDARFPATLPAASGVNLTALNATNIASGTLADARLSSKVPLDDVAEAISGVWDFSNGLKERGRTAKIGEWTSVAFAAGNFTGQGTMTWTLTAPDQIGFAYMLVGKTMTIAFTLATTTVGGVVNTLLQFAIPGGFVAAVQTWAAMGITISNGVNVAGACGVTAGATVVLLTRSDGLNWAAGTDNTYAYGTIIFEVQ